MEDLVSDLYKSASSCPSPSCSRFEFVLPITTTHVALPVRVDDDGDLSVPRRAFKSVVVNIRTFCPIFVNNEENLIQHIVSLKICFIGFHNLCSSEQEN